MDSRLRFGTAGKGGLLILSLLVAAALSACSSGTSKEQIKERKVPVVTAVVGQKTVPVQLRAIGNVEAYTTVEVKARIDGELLRVHFREGQDVNRGDLLFTIDPRPFEAMLKQAEANLAKDLAQLENARVETSRYAELVRKGYVAQQQYDQVRTNFAALEATVNADKALVENARLQLKYCYIYSPVTGRTGSLIADQGNLIKANADNPMVVVNQIQPIYVNFSVPEQYLNEIKKYMSTGKVKVDVFVSGEGVEPEQGVLTFVDNTVDTATGTIKLKATSVNKGKRLWPGQFVNVVITLTEQPNATVVPSQAIQTGQQGQFVFVVKSDSTVEARPVVAGIALEGDTVIQKGLQPGETVVTDGQMLLVPGVKVEVSHPQGADGKARAGSPVPGEPEPGLRP